MAPRDLWVSSSWVSIRGRDIRVTRFVESIVRITSKRRWGSRTTSKMVLKESPYFRCKSYESVKEAPRFPTFGRTFLTRRLRRSFKCHVHDLFYIFLILYSPLAIFSARVIVDVSIRLSLTLIRVSPNFYKRLWFMDSFRFAWRPMCFFVIKEKRQFRDLMSQKMYNILLLLSITFYVTFLLLISPFHRYQFFNFKQSKRFFFCKF